VTLATAREVLADAAAEYVRLYEAAVAVVGSPDAGYDDLLSCLKRGGIAAEIGAMALYKRTGRIPEPFIYDAADWTAYLSSKAN
jgi:hypothetical protein